MRSALRAVAEVPPRPDVPANAELEHELETAQSQREEYRRRLVEIEARVGRRRLPEERRALTHHFVIHALGEDGTPADHDGYITVGFYEDGSVGEIFLKMHRQGGTVSGFCEAWAIAVSLLLQTGTTLEEICAKYRNLRFEPSGRTDTRGIRIALSPIDYVARYLERRFVQGKELADE